MNVQHSSFFFGGWGGELTFQHCNRKVQDVGNKTLYATLKSSLKITDMYLDTEQNMNFRLENWK